MFSKILLCFLFISVYSILTIRGEKCLSAKVIRKDYYDNRQYKQPLYIISVEAKCKKSQELFANVDGKKTVLRKIDNEKFQLVVQSNKFTFDSIKVDLYSEDILHLNENDKAKPFETITITPPKGIVNLPLSGALVANVYLILMFYFANKFRSGLVD
ncbi:hypothetical protein SNEBB_000656 [Seison nebaliae]|nr:hypothetical protein SNEBB_000656 [Seison nebaliae]